MNYYISDTHFGHKNILSYDNRPFFDVAEMEREMIELWNETVHKKDDVYILGDVVWRDEEWNRVLSQLKGRKHLVRGNHDPLPDKVERLAPGQFVSIDDYLEIGDNGRHVILSHFPIGVYKNLHRPDWYHLYGHVHDMWEAHAMDRMYEDVFAYWEMERKAFNVGCMLPYMNYIPRTLDEIIEGYKTNRK